MASIAHFLCRSDTLFRKVLFLAPTRPLVAQQVHSCRSVVGLPHSDIEEVTGQMKAEIRRKVWGSRRVVFATPQVVINDLNNDLIDKEKICCIVIDEAHKATGNHAYCQVVNNLHEAWKRASEKYYREGRGDVFSAGPLERCYRTREKAANRSMAGYGGGAFRLLALTATPGRAFQDIQTIVTNLLAAKVLVRTDSDPDVRQYSHGRSDLPLLATCRNCSPLLKKRRDHQDLLFSFDCGSSQWIITSTRDSHQSSVL